MNERDADKSPEQIQNDIAHIRAQVSSTIDAIQSKLTPGQMMDQALDYFRKGSSGSTISGGSSVNLGAVTEGASEFATNLGNAVRANPLPVAVIGLGVAWLMMSNRSGPSVPYDAVTGPRGTALYGRTSRVYRRDTSQDALHDSDYDESYAAATDYGSAGEDYIGTDTTSSDAEGGVLSGAASAVGEAGRNLRDKASDVADRARQAAARARERVSSGAQHARDRVSSGTEYARDRVSSGASYAGDRASQLADRSREQFHRARSGVTQMADEQPLVIAAFGIAIGAALGALLPSTRKEDELLGDKRDELLQTAKEAVQPHVDTIKESATRVAEQAKQELQSVTATVKETAKQEFQTVKETAKQEFQQTKDSVTSSAGQSATPGSGTSGGTSSGASTGTGSTGTGSSGTAGSSGGIGSNIAGATVAGGGSTSVGATGSTSGVRTPSENLEHAHASSTKPGSSTSGGSIDSTTDRGGRPV